MNNYRDKIFIIYSSKGTSKEIITKTIKLIEDYGNSNSNNSGLRFKPLLYDIPSGTTSGETVNSQVIANLSESLASIVFLDGLRPNIYYELGYIHGQDKAALLITQKIITSTWKDISDLAGVPLLLLPNKRFKRAVHNFIRFSLMHSLASSKNEFFPFPDPQQSVFKSNTKVVNPKIRMKPGNFGPTFVVNSWQGVLLRTDVRITKETRFYIILQKLTWLPTHFNIYFRVSFVHSENIQSTIWVGYSSLYSQLKIEQDERVLPALQPSRSLQMCTSTFGELFEKVKIKSVKSIELLDAIRIRAGNLETRNMDTHGFRVIFLGTL